MRIKNCIYSAFTLENPMEVSKSCHWRCRSRSFWGCDWHWPEPEPGLVPVYHRWPGEWSHSLTEICSTRFFLLRSKFMTWTYSQVTFQLSINLRFSNLSSRAFRVWECQVILDQPVIRVVQSRRSYEGSQHLGSGGKLQEVSHFKLLQYQPATVFRSKSFAKYENIQSSLSSARPVLMFGFQKPLEIWKFKSPGKLSKMENIDESLKMCIAML